MVIFMHIDYNNSCTRVFRMRLMVIDIHIDKTLGILGQFTLKRVHAEDAGGSGQKIGVSDQEPVPPTASPLGSFSLNSRGLQAESKAKRDLPTHPLPRPRGPQFSAIWRVIPAHAHGTFASSCHPGLA